MSIAEMATTLQELKRLQEDLAAEITTTENAIKSAMGEQEQVTAGAFKITYRAVTSTRIDGAALRKELPAVAARYTKTTTCKRFTVA